jgi:hypothetical protein
VIYCVVPRELESELFDTLTAYYAGNPGVTVIVDRRISPFDRRRQRGADGDVKEQRQIRDRRRARAVGTFPSTEVPEP